MQNCVFNNYLYDKALNIKITHNKKYKLVYNR
jgi:hypothetical protein